MSSSSAGQVVCALASLLVFPDEILEDIFLRLDAAADVSRASAACTTFHRIVSARRFRRRFRSLHPPPILGVLECAATAAFHPAEPPHGSARAARALAEATDFTFSFIDAPGPWRVYDARDRRVLFCRHVNTTAAFADLMVCDPLHRRYVQLPPIPDDLAAATGGEGHRDLEPLLDPATDDDEDESFRVICAVQCPLELVTFHFSSVTGKWRVVTFDRTRPLSDITRTFLRHYAHGCFYWTHPFIESLFILDPREVKFSDVGDRPSYMAPPIVKLRAHAIVELGNGSIGLVSCVDGDTLQLYSKTVQNNGVDTEEWQHDKMIPLPKMEMHCDWNIKGAAEGYLLLQATPRDYVHILPNENRPSETHHFTLDLKTFLFERLCMSNLCIGYVKLYAGFPSTLSLPSV